MRTLPMIALMVVVGVAPLTAQDADTTGSSVLRDRIERAFVERARDEMALTDEQTAKLQATTERMFTRRQAIAAETRRLNESLAAQMRPGVAGDARVIRSALDSIVTLRIAAAQLYREEQRDLATYLTDVQRAQYHLLRERFLTRVQDVRARRADPGARRPLMRRQP